MDEGVSSSLKRSGVPNHSRPWSRGLDIGPARLRRILRAAVARGSIETRYIAAEVLEAVSGILSSRLMVNLNSVTRRDVPPIVDRVHMPALHYHRAERCQLVLRPVFLTSHF
jgi:hypothetical protein